MSRGHVTIPFPGGHPQLNQLVTIAYASEYVEPRRSHMDIIMMLAAARSALYQEENLHSSRYQL